MLLILSSIVFSQEKIVEGHVFDNTTKKPLDYVYLLDEENKILTLTDENGYFRFQVRQNSTSNIKLHKYGYRDTILDANSDLDTLRLRTKSIQLDEVVVNNVNKRFKYLLYYFKTYEFKNETKRRYLDGILQIEHDTKKNKVDYKVIEYRSFANDSMIKNEKGGIISIQHEGTGYPAYTLMSIYELIKKYGDFELDKIQDDTFQITAKSGISVGKINTSPQNKEISATLTHYNDFGKINRKLRASAKVLFKIEEEKYLEEDNYNTLEYRALLKKSLFKKGSEDNFSIYETHSKIYLIDYEYDNPFYKNSVQIKRDQSNFSTEFWKNSSVKKNIDLKLYEKLNMRENKAK